jgi:hypothetical protein
VGKFKKSQYETVQLWKPAPGAGFECIYEDITGWALPQASVAERPLRSRLQERERAMGQTSRNKLLSSLSKSDFALLEPHLEPVTLSMRKVLEKPNSRITAAYFPERGFASVVAQQANGKEVEVGLIGREGMTGMPIVLGNHRTPHSTYIQAAGDGHCIRATDLRQAIRASRSLHDTLLKFVQAFGVQTAHTAISNARSKWTSGWRA